MAIFAVRVDDPCRVVPLAPLVYPALVGDQHRSLVRERNLVGRQLLVAVVALDGALKPRQNLAPQRAAEGEGHPNGERVGLLFPAELPHVLLVGALDVARLYGEDPEDSAGVVVLEVGYPGRVGVDVAYFMEVRVVALEVHVGRPLGNRDEDVLLFAVYHCELGRGYYGELVDVVVRAHVYRPIGHVGEHLMGYRGFVALAGLALELLADHGLQAEFVRD